MNRTHNNGELRLEHVGQTVELKGWVAKQRNLGGLIFIDLRDRFGITQIVVEPTNENYDIAETARNEFVVYVKGQVVERHSKNKNIPTGEVEVVASYFEILNTAQTTPIIISDETDALEDTRLKYRYLDLRRPVMQNYLVKRHQITQAIRESLLSNDFLELETPILAKSTPEGARDYLVPSRLYPGEFYALPQSPQIFKQLFMVSGLERYFQVARCFRDEDLRADRQPEFTQIDIEASFITEEEIQTLTENTFKHLFKKVLNLDIQTPFIRMTYADAMNNYGSDKPDTRFDMLLTDLTDIAKSIDFKVFSDALENNGAIKAIVVKNNAAQYSRKNIDALTDFVKKYRAKGLAWVKYENNEFNGSIAKFLNEENQVELKSTLGLENNDLVLIVADSLDVCNASLGALRIEVAKQLQLIDPNKFNFLWVVDWPLFEYDAELGRYFAAHHPFTAPKDEHKELLLNNPGACMAKAYDIVLNGYEVGGGSLRIYNQQMQADMFTVLGFSEEEAKERFGFFIDALKYGTPPHGGIALGLDRIVMIMTHTDNIKDVVAFPKTQSARCPMMDGPGEVAMEQLEELHIQTKK